jgi:hypothetical protein
MEVLQIPRHRESCCLVLVFGLSRSPFLLGLWAVLDYVWTTVPLFSHSIISSPLFRNPSGGSVSPQRRDRIDSSSAQGRYEARDHCDNEQQPRGQYHTDQLRRCNVVQQRAGNALKR